MHSSEQIIFQSYRSIPVIVVIVVVVVAAIIIVVV